MHYNIIILLCFISFILVPNLAISFDNSEQWLDVDDVKYYCGVNSTFLVMRMLGGYPNYTELKKRLLPKKDSKVSIADLEKVLGEYKIKTLTLALRPSQLYNNPNCLFIMYTPPPVGGDMGHFNVIHVIDNETVKIIDPPFPTTLFRRSDWASDNRIIFIAVGNLPKSIMELNILRTFFVFLVLFGVIILVYNRISKYNKS